MGRRLITAFTLDYQYPTANEYIAAERKHRQCGAKMKREATHYTKILSKHVGPIDERVHILFEWHVKGKHDPDNVAFAKKFILDGLQESGVLKNDSLKWISGFEDVFIKDLVGYVKLYLYSDE